MEWLSQEERQQRELEEALAIHDRAMRVDAARRRWDLPASWDGGPLMKNVLNEKW